MKSDKTISRNHWLISGLPSGSIIAGGNSFDADCVLTPPDEFLGCRGRARQRPVSDGIEQCQALFIPTSYQGSVDVDAWYSFRIQGNDFAFEVAGVELPPIISYDDSRKWLPDYDPHPIKQVAKRFRLCLFDAIITVARALKTLMVVNIIAWGEGALVVAAMLSPDLRALAFKERHLGHEERSELEDATKSF